VTEEDLIVALDLANARVKRASAALAPKHKGGEIEEFHSAYEAMLSAERALAAHRVRPHAVPIEFEHRWDIGAPLPHVFQSDYRTFLLFLLRDAPLNNDGTYVKVVSASSASNVGIVEFHRCMSAKFGTPNDEVNDGHPLHGAGFVGYRALRVINSPWIAELRSINSVHRCFDSGFWEGLTHYIFGFHDSTFECVAQDFSVSTTPASLQEAIAHVCGRLLE
jgi:hypothetical protein